MGTNNYLIPPEQIGMSTGDDLIVFEWGELREYQYKIGDKVIWGESKPKALSGKFEIPGIGYRDSRQEWANYYSITIDDNVITAVRVIDEKSYDESLAQIEREFGSILGY